LAATEEFVLVEEALCVSGRAQTDEFSELSSYPVKKQEAAAGSNLTGQGTVV